MPPEAAPLRSDPQAAGLPRLEARLVQDLSWLNLSARPWVPAPPQGQEDVLDVAIIGAGLNGLAAAASLKFLGITRMAVLDLAPEGREGPWLTTARMRTLRTAKDVQGPALGIPSLTCRAWYEAQHGAAAWASLAHVPRTAWMDYMIRLRRVLGLPVRNGVTVTAITPDDAAPLRIGIAGAGLLRARRVVLATGIDGLGGPTIPAVIAGLPRRFWAHTSEAIDFAALAGKRVGVLGAGASAMDNAAVALEAGEISAVREPPMPWRRSGRATLALRDTTASAKRAYQPAGNPLIGTETL